MEPIIFAETRQPNLRHPLLLTGNGRDMAKPTLPEQLAKVKEERRKVLAIIEAAERHLRSFHPASIEGSELALARALADYGSETGKWACQHYDQSH